MSIGRTIRWVALAVAAAAITACGGGDDPPDAAPDGALHIEAGDMFFAPGQFAAGAGQVTFSLENVGGIEHDLVIEELGDLVVIDDVAPGRSSTGSVDLDAGTYTLYCSVPGHRQAGMEATLEVS